MKLIEKMANDYYQKRPEGFGNPTDDFMAGFRAARDLMVKQITDNIGHAGLNTIGCNENLGDEDV